MRTGRPAVPTYRTGGPDADLHKDQPLSRSLIAFAGVKVSFFDAAMVMVCPVAGLRPSRAGLAFTLNLPKPLSAISSPLAAASAIAVNRPSTRSC